MSNFKDVHLREYGITDPLKMIEDQYGILDLGATLPCSEFPKILEKCNISSRNDDSSLIGSVLNHQDKQIFR